MADVAKLACLGCGKSTTVPSRLIKMSEKVDGKPVCFCSRLCNYEWVKKRAEKHLEANMRETIKRLENQNHD